VRVYIFAVVVFEIVAPVDVFVHTICPTIVGVVGVVGNVYDPVKIGEVVA
jgi:hypothetical protein